MHPDLNTLLTGIVPAQNYPYEPKKNNHDLATGYCEGFTLGAWMPSILCGEAATQKLWATVQYLLTLGSPVWTKPKLQTPTSEYPIHKTISDFINTKLDEIKNHAGAKLNDEQHRVLNLKALLDIVSLYQNDYKHQSVLQNAHPLDIPITLQASNQQKKIEVPFIWNQKTHQLNIVLAGIRKIFSKMSPCDVIRIPITLTFANHIVGLTFNPQYQCWALMDINEITIQKKVHLYKTTNDILTNLKHDYGEPEKVNIYSTSELTLKMQQVCKDLKADIEQSLKRKKASFFKKVAESSLKERLTQTLHAAEQFIILRLKDDPIYTVELYHNNDDFTQLVAKFAPLFLKYLTHDSNPSKIRANMWNNPWGYFASHTPVASSRKKKLKGHEHSKMENQSAYTNSVTKSPYF